MAKYEIEQLVNNFEHGIRVMESDSNIMTYKIRNMMIRKEDNGYFINIITIDIPVVKIERRKSRTVSGSIAT